MVKRVADIIIETAVDQGINDCFLVAGGGAMHLDNALALCSSITKYCNHHEQACTMAAEAYARLSGRMAMACVTSGPGATNAITGVMGAYQDSLPMLVISGQVRYQISSMSTNLPLRYRGIQEFDIISSVKNMTKYSKMITDPLSCREEIIKACNIAMSGRRGPVWIDVPLDIQSSKVDTEDLYPSVKDTYGNLIDEEIFEGIFDTIRNAQRPCILCGTGIVSAGVQKEFEDFVNRMGIPVISGGWCTDALYTEHPLYYGLSGDIGPRTGNFILQNADAILVLGNSLSFRQTGYAQEGFAPQAKILWVDVDETENKKPGMRAYTFLKADLHSFFERCLSENIQIKTDNKWINYCNMLRRRFSAYESLQKIDYKERVNSYYFWKEFEKYAPDEQIIAMGNSRANAAKIQIGVKSRGQRAITNYLCGSMGYDLPAAIGCAVASKKEVLCITGDGSIMMNLQELQTIAHNKLPVKVVVFANEGYEAIRQTNKNFFDGVFLGCTKESGISFPDFSAIAKAFGFRYKVCENNSQVDESLEWIFNEEGNLFLEIKQQLDNPITPKIMSRIREDGSFETPVLHDMAPFLSKDEIKELMFES